MTLFPTLLIKAFTIAGFVTEWETSNWMMYKVYSYKDKQVSLLYEPLPIWFCHIDSTANSYLINKSDIVSKSTLPGVVKVKLSDVRNNGEDFLIIDTVLNTRTKGRYIN